MQLFWRKKKVFTALGLILICLGSACSAGTPTAAFPSPAVDWTLTPFVVVVSESTPTPTPNLASPTPPPTPTATPVVYAVVSGDNLTLIANRYGLTLQELLAANPGLDPQFLSVGAELNIPVSGEDPVAGVAQLTPVPLAYPAGSVACTPSADGGLWCFWLVQNDSSATIENIAASINLYDANGEILDSGVLLAPLNILPPQQKIALTGFFPAPAGHAVNWNAQLTTAFHLIAGDARYLATELDYEVVMDSSGDFATVTGAVIFPEGSGPTKIWLALMAYDGAGNVVGVRRIEFEQETPFAAPFSFEESVYQLRGGIASVVVLVEARP